MWRKLLSAAVCSLLLGSALCADPIRVNIYYETYNEHVRKFMVEQLGPLDRTLSQFGDKIMVRYYPFGGTELSSPDNYTCTNGQTQCFANNLHLCYLGNQIMDTDNLDPDNLGGNLDAWPNDDYPDNGQAAATSAIACFFKNRKNIEDSRTLARSCGIPKNFCPSEFHLLVNKYMEKKTAGISLVNGLAITINNIPGLENNLVGIICNTLGPNTVDVCKTASPLVKQKVSVYYEANDQPTGKYFGKQLFPYTHVLEDFVDFELIPYGNINLDGSFKCVKDASEAKCQSTVFQAMVVNKYTSTELSGDIISGTNRAINFINCVFGQDASANVFSSLQTCSSNHLEPDEYRTIIDIMREAGGEYKKVLSAFSSKTLSAAGVSIGPVPRLPLVQLNGKTSINAYNDVILETCDKYKGSLKPKICNKVKLEILYQPMDHTTRTVFLENLKPLFDNLQNVVEFNFIPAGNLKMKPVTNETRKFDCATPELCAALKYQACIIDYYWNIGDNYTSPIRQDTFDVIQCMFKNKFNDNVDDNAQVCTELIDAWPNIENCYKNEADSILGENIEDTDGILNEIGVHDIDSVKYPAIVYQRSKIVEPTDLKKMICDKFDKYDEPDFCLKETPQKLKLKVFYNSDSEWTKSFFTTQYDPWYMYLEEMLDVELLPGANSGDPQNGNCSSYEPSSACFSNKIQAFVIDTYQKNPNKNDFIDGTMRTMRFLRCVFSHPLWKTDYVEASEICANDELAADEGFELIAAAKEDETIYPQILAKIQDFLKTINQEEFELLPWVNLGGDIAHSKRAANDLLQTACALWQGDKPLECTPVNVEVYYSGFHPQSRRFFVDELIPVFRHLRERIHLDLIPFGTLKTEDKDCKSSACKVNTLQACAITKYFRDEVQEDTIQWDGKNQTLSYIHCMFKNVENDKVDELSGVCANNNIILADAIHECAVGEDGKAALAEMRQRTANLMEEMDHAPWIVINGRRVAAAQTDLRSAICQAIVGDQPDYCSEPKAPKVVLQVHYSALEDASRNYILNELYTNYRNLEEIMDLDLVSLGQCTVLDIPGHPVLKCDNHEKEAHATLIHACVHDTFWHNDDDPVSDNDVENEFDGKIQVVQFLKCYYLNNNYPDTPEKAGSECVEQIFGDVWKDIHECVQEHGYHILKKLQDDVVANLRPSLTYTPWITVNKVHNYAVENHVLRTVCDSYKGREKPAACYEKGIPDPKPVVQVHYEIDDLKTMPFFLKYLLPERANEIGDMTFIPFGRSKVDDKGEFVCQNNDDCHQYRLHLCLIDTHFKTEPVRTMNTIACTFESTNIGKESAVNDCANREFEDEIYDDIIKCAKNDEVSKPLLQAAQQAVQNLGIKMSHSPWIVINEEHNLEAESNILDELCAVYYPTDRPAACKMDLLPVNVFYQTKDNDVATFFRDQLEEYIQYLNEIGKFDYVPYGKTTVAADGSFQCSTPEQCTLNMAHACVIDIVMNDKVENEEDRILNQIRLGEFLVCTFTTVVPDKSTFYKNTRVTAVEEKCAELNLPNIPDIWEEVHDCINSDRGKNLIDKAMEKTEEAQANKGDMPFIQIAGKVPAKTRDAFFQVLCDTYDTIRPPLCRTIRDHGIETGIYFSGNEASRDYFNDQVKPLYEHIAPGLVSNNFDGDEETEVENDRLYRLLSAELIPWGNTKYDANNAAKPFLCEGENECYINQFFACAISAHRSEPKSKLHLMEFAVCFFAQENALTASATAAELCVDRVWTIDPFVELNICAKSVDQSNVEKLLAMKEKTENFLPSNVKFPAITIKNNYNQQASQTYLSNFLCYHYKGIDKPEEYCAKFDTTPPPITDPPPTDEPITSPTTTTEIGVPDPDPTTSTTEISTTTDPDATTTPVTVEPTTPKGSSATIFSYTIFVMIAAFFVLSHL